jgi:hypothetical protein
MADRYPLPLRRRWAREDMARHAGSGERPESRYSADDLAWAFEDAPGELEAMQALADDKRAKRKSPSQLAEIADIQLGRAEDRRARGAGGVL